MRQAGLLAASFLVTITILGGLFFVLESGSPQATPSPTATATPTVAPPTGAPTARPTAAPTAAPTPTPLPTASPTPRPTSAPTSAPTASPLPTVAPSAGPSASPGTVGPDGRMTIVVPGTAYVAADVPSNGTITPGADGGITMRTNRTIASQMEVTWELPAEAIPAGYRILSIDTSVCGTGSGDFWESYGPDGSDPAEHEVTAPGAGGCWHFKGAPGPDTTVKAIIRLASVMTITRIDFMVTVTK